LIAGEVDAARLVFVDEMGANISLSPLYAWARRGERALCKAPRNWGKNVTLLASMTSEGMGPCMAVVGSITRAAFEAYVERVLAPSLSAGQVVVMDNLSAHKGGRVKEIVEGVGCELLYLPRPTRRTSQPHRAGLCQGQGAALWGAGARTREALIEAMGAALSAVSARDVSGFVGHCGYRTLAQSL
jgi:hypothetical protein